MSLKLYFVRHGQSESNLFDVFYDDADEKLTELGKKQSEDLGRKLKGITFRAIYSSPYERAKSTCAIALESAGISGTVIYDDRLKERDFKGLFSKNVSEDHYIELYKYGSDRSKRDGIETLDELEKRARAFLKDLKKKYQDGNILVFSHGIFGLAIYTVVYGRPASLSMYDLRLQKNGELRIFTLLR